MDTSRVMDESQCLLFFAFLWERCGDRDLDFLVFRSGDGDRERLDHLGDLVLFKKDWKLTDWQKDVMDECIGSTNKSLGTCFKGEMLLDFRAWSSGSRLLPRLLTPSTLRLLRSLSLLSSFDLSLGFDVSLSFLSSSFSNSYSRHGETSQWSQIKGFYCFCLLRCKIRHNWLVINY